MRAPSTAALGSRQARTIGASASRIVLPGLAREVGGILRRHWWIAMWPAALLGAGADALLLLRHDLGAGIAVGIGLALAFELYVGYAELIVAADRGEGPPPRFGTILGRAASVAPPLLLASIAAVTLPLAATGLLVIPGVWLLTRWSLFAPAIVHEHLTPRAALRRSTALVSGAFWAVAGTVTASVLIEHAVIHGTAHTADSALGSVALGLVAAAVATMLVSPPAAFTISVVYERLSHARTGCAHPVDGLAGPRAGGDEPREHRRGDRRSRSDATGPRRKT